MPRVTEANKLISYWQSISSYKLQFHNAMSKRILVSPLNDTEIINIKIINCEITFGYIRIKHKPINSTLGNELYVLI